jgi:hypothetical protein
MLEHNDLLPRKENREIVKEYEGFKHFDDLFFFFLLINIY